jgi:7-keto-8-aminopelargonate synthetase-like enzyme
MLREDTTLVDGLRANIDAMRQALFLLGLPLPPPGVPIFTFALSPMERQEAIHERLKQRGYFAPLIAYPGGPAERYFRVVVNARHDAKQIDSLARELAAAMDATRDHVPLPASMIEVKAQAVRPLARA